MGISAGRLRHRLIVMRKTTTKEGTGFKETWSPIGDAIWAEVLGINGREAVIGQALQGVSYYKITVRAGADIRETDQLTSDDPAVFGGKTLNISAPPSDPDGRREQLLILANTGSIEAMNGG